MAERFWSFDGEHYERHGDARAAEAYARAALEQAREECRLDDGWPDWTESIAWGEVREAVVVSSRATHEDDCTAEECSDSCEIGRTDVDEAIDYDLRRPERPPFPDGVTLTDSGTMITVARPDGLIAHVHPGTSSLITYRLGKDSDQPRGVLLALAEAFRLAAERAVPRG